MPLQDHPQDHPHPHPHDRTHDHPHGPNEVSRTIAALIRDAAVLTSQVADLRADIDRRLLAQAQAVTLALAATEKTTEIAQHTADKAVLKFEATASKEYLESQIEALASVGAANLAAQKDALQTALISQEKALVAALQAAKDALMQAQESSEKAVEKAQAASDARFDSVNEFRKTLTEQARQFANKSEIDYRFDATDERVQQNMSQITEMRTQISEMRGKSQGSNWLWGVFLGAGGIVLTLVTAVTLVLTRTNN